MEFTVFGFKINVLNALIFLVVGFLVATLTVCSCSKVSSQEVKESMTNLANAALVDEVNTADVQGSWANKAASYAGNMGYETVLQRLSSNKGTPVPLENTMFYFQDNEFKPECCPSTYTTGNGCACSSVEQVKYLNERGGNRTMSSNF